MKSFAHTPPAALLAAALGWLICCAPGTPGGARADAAQDEPLPAAAGTSGPVLVELFTSQGCSSCPPADRLLTRLGADPELANRVLPLAFHVDYWNHIGWTDPFSSEEWSRRQRRYARAFEEGRVYTPQLVVDGRVDTVGSRQGEVYRLVREALERPDAAKLSVRLSAGEEPSDLVATVDAELVAMPEGDPDAPLELLVALYQKDLETAVERGENASRTLRNDFVVRRLVAAGEVPRREGGSLEERIVFELDPSWTVRDLGVVAFLQDPRTRAVHGAARATLAVIE